MREVQREIKNVQGVVRRHGEKHAAMESLMEDLERIEKERREIKKEIEEINDNDPEVQQYITDPEGVMEKLLDQKTYAEPRDPQLVRALIQLYVERIEIYRNHGVIYYHLGTRKGDQPATDTIYLTNEGQAACDSRETHDSLDAESCPLEGSMGVFLMSFICHPNPPAWAPHSILKELYSSTPLRFQGKPGEGQRQRKARGRNPVPPNPGVPPRNLPPPSPRNPKRRSKTAESTTETGPNAQSARNTTGKRPWNAAGPPRNSGFASTAAASPYPARPDAKTAPSGTGLTAGRMTPSEGPSR